MRETQVRSLGWEHPLEKEMASHSRILAWRNSSILALENPMDRGVWWAAVHGATESQTGLGDSHCH